MDRGRTHAPLILGSFMILLGAVFLARELGYLEMDSVWRLLAPFVLITLGLGQLLVPARSRARKGGWMILVGVLLLAHNLRVVRFGNSWPVFLLALGGSIVWQEVRRQHLVAARAEDRHAE